MVDAPLPGTEVFDRLRSDPRVWHFAFHGARDVAEMLVFGRERPYLQAFFNARSASGELVEEMMREVAEHVSGVRVPGTAHWVAEENREGFLAALLDFLSASAGGASRSRRSPA